MYSSHGLTLTLPVIVCFSVVLRFTGGAVYKRDNVLVYKQYSALVAFIDAFDSTSMMI